MSVAERIDIVGGVVTDVDYQDPYPDGSGGTDVDGVTIAMPDGRRIVLYPAWYNTGEAGIGVEAE